MQRAVHHGADRDRAVALRAGLFFAQSANDVGVVLAMSHGREHDFQQPDESPLLPSR